MLLIENTNKVKAHSLAAQRPTEYDEPCNFVGAHSLAQPMQSDEPLYGSQLKSVSLTLAAIYSAQRVGSGEEWREEEL